jgi:hypothetical protein
MPTDDLERFCCQNADCDLYGRRGAGNLSVCGHFGKACHRLLYCNACKARANRQRIANLLPTARRLLFVVSDRQRIAYSRARPIRPLGFRDGSSAPSAV